MRIEFRIWATSHDIGGTMPTGSSTHSSDRRVQETGLQKALERQKAMLQHTLSRLISLAVLAKIAPNLTPV
jgi:hypothetical protein